jgi:plastocyanin
MPRLSSLLPLTLIVAAACGSSDTGPSSPPDMVGDIGIVHGAEFLTTRAFDPNPQTVSLADGGGVRWVNRDGGSSYGGGAGVAHQITSDNGAFPMSDPIRPGQTYSITLSAAGTYHYHCNIHTNMVGTITVTP